MIIAALLLPFLLLGGCVSNSGPEPGKPDTPPKWEAVADKAVSITPLPTRQKESDDTVLEDLIPQPSEAAAPEGETGGETVTGGTVAEHRQLPTLPLTMKMHDVDLPVLIRTLARVADLDIMINDSIKGKTQIFVTNIPWDQAFLGVLDTFGLTYEWSGNILRVVSVEDLAKKQALLEARQNYETVKSNHDLAQMALSQKKSKLEPLVTKIVKIRYADLKSLQQNLSQYLASNTAPSAQKTGSVSPEMAVTGAISGGTGSPAAPSAASDPAEAEGRGSILADEFTNSLIIHATRSEIKKLMPIIRRLDQPIRQILIEAHIVEAESDTGRELGIQWGGLGTAATSSGKSVSLGGDMTEAGTDLETGYTPTDGNVVNLPIQSAASTASGLAFGVLFQKVGEYVLYSQLQALEEQGLLNILSSPSITTLDHRKATIKSGEQVPFQTVVNDEVSIEWKDAAVSLEVTPHIIDDNIIRLEIVTHKDELDFTNDVNGNPTIITKNAETNVMLFDGQTTVIGGMNKEKYSDSEAGVPGLRKVPGLGWFFNSTDRATEMEELLIFITPRILKGKTALPKG